MPKTARLRPAFTAALFCLLTMLATPSAEPRVTVGPSMVVYRDPAFYASFPSIVRRPDGELIAAFRRAPDRRAFGAKGVTHTDANSYLVQVRSRDNGKTWSAKPEFIYAHPFGGSQDPCLLQLSNGEILCASYAWSLLPTGAEFKPAVARQGGYAFLGGFLLRSTDGARTWSEAVLPPAAEGEARQDIFGKPLAAYNRGAMCQGADGKIYWVVAVVDSPDSSRTSNHLLVSADNGATWEYSAMVARDEKVVFNEASIYQTPKGDLVAFLRTANFEDKTCIARSKDGGKTFKWEDVGFKGHPHHAVQLPDKRALLVYGHRHKPFGIRARILNAECTDAAAAAEIILREDGGNTDIGYPWATVLDDETALVVYYFNQADGPRHIASTLLNIE